MTPHTHQLRQAGISLWLDNITRRLLDDGTLQRYIDTLHVTGLTSNPTIFDQAIGSGAYDTAIREKVQAGSSGEALFFDDTEENIDGARRVGLRAVRVRSLADIDSALDELGL